MLLNSFDVLFNFLFSLMTYQHYQLTSWAPISTTSSTLKRVSVRGSQIEELRIE